MSVNKVILIGNVCQEPAFKVFNNGGKVSQFSLATNERAYKTKSGTEIPERTEFHNIVLRGGLADIAEKYIRKGDKLFIEGTLRYRSYENENKVKVYITEIYATSLEMLSGKKNDAPRTSIEN